MWNQDTCRQVPRLPRKVPRRHRRLTKVDVAKYPRLPRKTKVYVTKCHACHVKPRHMSPSATPATQSAAAVQARHQSQPSALSTTLKYVSVL